jgi:ABC-type transport system substrate-binding protein
VAKNSGTKILKRTVLTTPAFWFVSFSGPLADRKVRQALNYAVNRDEIIRYSVLGNGEKIATMSMQGERGHNEGLEPYPYSLEKAKSMLSEAGYSKGFTINLLSSEQSARESRIISAQWDKIGVKTNLTILSMSEWAKTIISREQNFDIISNLAPNPTAHMYFLPGLCFYSQSPYGRLKSAPFDHMYEALIQTIEASEHLKKCYELDKWIYDQALCVSTYQKIRTFGMNKKLSFIPHVTGMLHLRKVSWE